ncbi:MAG: SpoIIE family protein phosphatase [Spirochaetes bacterium]|nr:SpoIIE family protein phosphatase [Spirochaetota bacterium]
MIPVYFNFFSIGWLIALSFYVVSAIFCFTIKNRSRAAFHLGMAFVMAAIGSAAYAISASIYLPIASMNRYFTISSTMGTLTFATQFFFCFPDDDYRKQRSVLLVGMWAIIIVATLLFMYRSISSGYQYLFLGHVWDFKLDELSKAIGYVILLFALIAIGSGVWRFAVTKGRVRWAVLMCAISIAIVSVIPSVANILSRDGAIGRETYLILLVALSVVGFFLVLIIFINNTRDRTTFMTKVIGICLVFFLVILLGLSYYASNVNERSYDTIHHNQTKMIMSGYVQRPRDLRYIERYSVADGTMELLFGGGPAAPNFSRLQYDYMNAVYYERIRLLTPSNCGTELPGIINTAHPYFEGYKNELAEFAGSLSPSVKDPVGAILGHMSRVNTLVFYYTNKIQGLPVDSFRQDLKSLLAGSKVEFGHFRRAIEMHVENSTGDGESLKADVLKYLAPFKAPGTRHYRRGRDGLSHYISFMEYNRQEDALYDVGFSYVAYREYLHPDSMWLILLLVSVVLVISIVFRFFFLGTLIHPLNNVLDGLMQVQKGNLDVNIPIRVEDEIGFISHNFNEMVWSMSAARKKLDDYAMHLEEKVEQRTAELKSANEYLTATMGVMDAMNDELITANKELKEAERIATMDMTMASNVQSSFFPKEPPRSGEWEISFLFRPMTGISGDMYDFYERGGDIVGLSLFDVSGHGIASGLITMIAKTVIYRNFHGMEERKLHEIMESVNEELIQEIGKVDNYLTGILVRFNGNRIELVNAGHTDPLFYGGKDGRVKVVDIKGGSIKGMFLGIEIMKGSFNTLSFTMNRNDMLLLYSDCMLESKDAQGEEFGLKRLIQTFKDNGTGDTKTILNRIGGALMEFIGSEKLTDDLTVILVRRLV